MKASDLQPFAKINQSFQIQTSTDANQVISNEYQLERFIEEYGNVTVGTFTKGVYNVPEFAERREKFRAAKLAYCEQYGSN